MEVTNKYERRRARWRFWILYFVSVFMTGLVLFNIFWVPSSLSPDEKAKCDALELKQELWKNMSKASTSLDAISDLEKKPGGYYGLSKEDRENADKLGVEFEELKDKIIKICQADINSYKEPKEVITALGGYYALIKLARTGTNEDFEKLKERLEREHKQKVDNLEEKIDDLEEEKDDLKDQITILRSNQ